MKLARYTHDGVTSTGLVTERGMVDIPAALDRADPDIPALLASAELLAAVRALDVAKLPAVPLSAVKLEAAVRQPGKFLALGMNYKDHEEEARRHGVPIPASQVWFNKQTSCLHGPYDPVVFPKVAERLDYEAELGVVIGKAGRYIAVEDALSHVGGYFVANDVTSRDWQARSPTWTLGKSFDTHGPIGPWVTTADEVPDPQALGIRLSVNGEVRQDSHTSRMTYSVAEQISYLSQVMTLQPGDLLITGTPAGVGLAMTPPGFLQPGDVVRVEIDGLGHIENTIVAE